MNKELSHDDIRYIVKRVLRNYQIQGRDSAARAIATEIKAAIDRTYGMNKEWNLIHNFPVELEPLVRKLERGLGLRMKRDEGAAEVYRWVLEQEQHSKPVAKFIEWAVAKERVQYVGKYRNSPEAIRVDYRSAFDTSGTGRQMPKAETL